jgi:hypothetical protein
MEPYENPYASPTADLTAPLTNDSSTTAMEQVRRKYLNHQASVQSVGWLYWIGSVVIYILAFSIVFGPSLGRGSDFSFRLIMGAVYFGFATLSLWLGYGFRKLDRRARIPAGIFSALGLLSFPIGTIINGYILYLIFSAKGSMVFSPEYKELIRQTPHIRYRTSIIVRILLVLVLALFAFAGTAAIFRLWR